MRSRRPSTRIAFVAAALVVAFSGPATPISSARVALVIGNGSYQGISPLPNPTNDAVALGATLAGIGFDVDVVVDADRASLESALANLETRASGADVALIFYAGHGMQLEGTNYLLPTDFVPGRTADVQTGAVAMDELLDVLSAADPETAILIMDACRDNPFASAIGADQGLATGTAATARAREAGTLIAFSAAPGAVALDGANGNSPYTTALLQWIDRPGIELGTMFRRVRGTVLELTGEEQVPWVEESLVEDVFLNPLSAETPLENTERMEDALLNTVEGLTDQDERAAAQTFYDRYLVNASVNRGQGSRETRASNAELRAGLIWMSIRDTDDPEVLRAFVERFPGDQLASLAERRITELAETTPQPAGLTWLDELPPVPPRPASAPGAGGAIARDGAGSQGSVTQISNVAPGGTTQGGEGASQAAASDYGQTAPSTDTAPTETAAPAAPLPPPTPEELEAELGLEPAEMRAAQILLAELGYYRFGIDGAFGPGTRGGIETLQADSDLPPTGYLTVETLRQLIGQAAPFVLASASSASYHDGVHDLAAIAIKGPGAEPEVIRVEAINRNDDVHAYWREIADEFEAENPGTQIEITHRPDWEYKVDLMGLLGAEDPPDLIYTWSGGHLDALREAGFARDLTEEMSEGWAFEFKPGALQTYTHEGQVYGVPMHLALLELYANGPVLARAGIPPEQLRTWDGFMDAILRLKSQGIQPLAVGGFEAWPYKAYFGQLAQQIAGDATIRAALEGETTDFTDPAFSAAGDQFERLAAFDPFQPGQFDTDDGVATQLVASGDAAMIVTGTWRLQKFFWDWTGGSEVMDRELIQLPFPSVGGDTELNVTYGGADGFAVSPDAPDVAIDFLRRLTAIDVQERMAIIAADIPAASGADLTIESERLANAADRLLMSDYHQLYLDQELGPVGGAILNNGLVEVVQGLRDVDDVLAEIAASRE